MWIFFSLFKLERESDFFIYLFIFLWMFLGCVVDCLEQLEVSSPPGGWRRIRRRTRSLIDQGFTSSSTETAGGFKGVKQRGGVFLLVRLCSWQAVSSAQLSVQQPRAVTYYSWDTVYVVQYKGSVCTLAQHVVSVEEHTQDCSLFIRGGGHRPGVTSPVFVCVRDYLTPWDDDEGWQ